jgi:hypothetical protein
MKIKNFKSFLEAISGMELPSTKDLVNYGQEDNSPMKKLGTTDVIHSDLFGIVVTYDQYQDYYIKYLGKGGTPLHGFNLENLDKVLGVLNN